MLAIANEGISQLMQRLVLIFCVDLLVDLLVSHLIWASMHAHWPHAAYANFVQLCCIQHKGIDLLTSAPQTTSQLLAILVVHSGGNACLLSFHVCPSSCLDCLKFLAIDHDVCWWKVPGGSDSEIVCLEQICSRLQAILHIMQF